MELQGSGFLISHTFQRNRDITIARTGNFIMYALDPFSRKRSHILRSQVSPLSIACMYGEQFSHAFLC